MTTEIMIGAGLAFVGLMLLAFGLILDRIVRRSRTDSTRMKEKEVATS